MSDWDDLGGALDQAAAAGRQAAFWWRDDDAGRDGPRLRRLLATAGATPLALAVVPASLEPSLADALADAPGAVVWQHGYSHRSHAPAGEKKAELGGHRPLESMLAELRAGRDILRAGPADRVRPVLVPPWNRIDPALVARLPEAGFTGLSCFGSRDFGQARGLRQAHCHLDLIDWRGDRGFIGEAAALAGLVRRLRETPPRLPDAKIPLGIMSHHRDQDEAGWSFLAKLVRFVHEHPKAGWFHPDEIFNVIE